MFNLEECLMFNMINMLNWAAEAVHKHYYGVFNRQKEKK